MTLVSHWFVQRRRRFGRALLLGLAVVWSTMAAAPCVAAMPACQHTPADMTHCPHDKAGASTPVPDCTPLMQLDCQADQNPTLTSNAVSADHLPSLPMVLLGILPIAAAETGGNTDSAVRHTASAAAVPRPPLNLLHARLLI
jgi:hypothetical protein